MMFKAALIVCMIVGDGGGALRCTGRVEPTPLPTGEACVRQTVAMAQVARLSLPPGAYVFARKCIPVYRPPPSPQ